MGAPACYIGIEIGGTKIQLVAGDAEGRVHDRRRVTVDAAGGAEGIRGQIAGLLPDLVARWNPRAIGVGFGGPLNCRTGAVINSHQVAGWTDFPLGAWLADLSHLPVFVDNDANVAALAESILGAGRGFDPVFYVTIGSGIGGGLVHDQRIYHGDLPGEAEIGHLRIDPSGATLESLCSGWALDRRIRQSIPHHPDSSLCRRAVASPGHEARHLAVALAEGDELARRILDDAARKLALALSHVTHLVHPQVIVLGGGVSLIGAPLRDAVAAHLPPLLMEAFRPGPRVAIASLGEDAVPAGALMLAFQYFNRIAADEITVQPQSSQRTQRTQRRK